MKKKIVLMVIMGIMLFSISLPVFATDITACNEVLGDSISIDEKIPNTISTIILVIQVVVPVLLVIFGMIDLMKGVMSQKEDEIKKGQQIFIKRLIAGILVFFVATIVKLVVSFAAGDDGKIMNCANCFINGVDSCNVNDAGTAGSDAKCPSGKEYNEQTKKCESAD